MDCEGHLVVHPRSFFWCLQTADKNRYSLKRCLGVPAATTRLLAYTAISKPIELSQSPIDGLLRVGCPATVTRFVVARRVFSVYSVRGTRFSPHVFKKSGKAIPPPITHLDTSGAIPAVRFVFRVVTA